MEVSDTRGNAWKKNRKKTVCLKNRQTVLISNGDLRVDDVEKVAFIR